MIALRFLELFKPISRVIPEVKPPERKVSFAEIELAFAEERARQEAKRCLRCDLEK